MNNPGTLFLDTFTTHLHTIQNLDGQWHFILEFFPDKSSGKKNVMISSQITFTEYEYAIEEAIEAIEIIGFSLVDKTLISVYEFNSELGGYNKKIVEFDNENFKTIDEMFIDFDTFFELMNYDENIQGNGDAELLH